MDGTVVPRKENAGYHKNTLGVPLPSERKELEWVGGLGQVIKSVIRDLCLGFTACVFLGAQSSGPGPDMAWLGLPCWTVCAAASSRVFKDSSQDLVWNWCFKSVCGLSLTLRTPDFVDEK